MTTKETKEPIVSTSRIITLLESNDVSNTVENGQWTNNLAEETILNEGDSLFVRNSMIDTTPEAEGIIDVLDEETDITIQYGMYLQDSGNGTLNGGNANTVDFLTFSEGAQSSPSGKNYILQNHIKGLPFTEMWYLAGAMPAGPLAGTTNPGIDPADTFSIRFIPTTGATDWWEYTLDVGTPYTAPVGAPFPNPPRSVAPSPIIKPENLSGLKAILKSGHVGGKAFAIYNIYASGFEPASGTPQPVYDHIATVETLYDGNNNPFGYQSKYNDLFLPNPAVADENQWVFRTAIDGAGDTSYQYWLNYDPVTFEESKIFRVCTGFYMIVDNFTLLGKGKQPNSSYQTTLSYTSLGGKKETATMNFTDWGNANGVAFDTLFAPHKGPQPPPGLPDMSTVKSRKANGFEVQYADGELFWIEFSQLTDPRNPLYRIFEPFVYDVSKGIGALPLAASPFRGQSGGPGFAFGIYNPGNSGGVSNPLLLSGQIIEKPAPAPTDVGVTLQPRIFTQKITIRQGKYTYDGLAQELTDQLNSIPRVVPQLNNNPFAVPPPASNPLGFSGSRLLTSTYEIGMQQTDATAAADRVPFFPSNFVWETGDATNFPLLQPVWLSETGDSIAQFDETSLAGADNPRWCGAEALSFIYDETSDTFQVAQAHTNMYSRLDASVIARQFKVGAASDQYVTADKMGGIFLTSLEPQSLFFDKMKLQQQHAGILVTQLSQNPTLRDLKIGSINPLLPHNVNLDNTLTHTITLTNGINITGNFVGRASKIDKRTRIPPLNAGDPDIVTGGGYGAVRTQWDLDVATDTPVTIPGTALTAQEVTDPFFQLEISGINRQDIVGAEVKNNLIQSIVGKYFTNGGFVAGNVDDSFRYTHLGEPISIRSLDVRVLDSTGEVSSGLGPNTAIILEVDGAK